MSELYLKAGPGAPERREVDEVARALAGAGLPSRVADDSPIDAVRLVWADDLDESLAAVAGDERARWLERTILVNESRDRVLERLEEHGLLGAVEYEEVSDWLASDSARLFARKDVVSRRGEQIGGASRESAAYALWADPTATSLASALGKYLAYWRESDVEIVVSAEEATGKGLPPLELRVKIGGTGLLHVPSEHSTGHYIQLSSPPGGGTGFAARPAPEPRVDDLERAARSILEKPDGPELRAGGPERARVAGAERDAICFLSEWLLFRTGTCVVHIPHANGALMAFFTSRLGADTAPSCEAVLSRPALRRIASTLRVIDAPAR